MLPKMHCDDAAAKDVVAAMEKNYKDSKCEGEAKWSRSMLAPDLPWPPSPSSSPSSPKWKLPTRFMLPFWLVVTRH